MGMLTKKEFLRLYRSHRFYDCSYDEAGIWLGSGGGQGMSKEYY